MTMLEQWQHNEPVSIFASDGETEQEYRLTFKTMSAFEEAKFSRNRNKAGAILEELFGPAKERTDEQNEDAWAMFDVLIKHAAIMAALAKVEVRSVPQPTEDDAPVEPGDWTEARLPDAWYNAKEFPYHAPASVLNLLFDAVIAAGNPYRLFSFLPASDAEKKALRLTVRPSAS